MNPDRDRADESDAPASPYGPHPRGVDEAAGGADSSPHEAQPTGERLDRAEDERQKGREPDRTANDAP
ncbi:MAG TPA: hypothetical protein VM529_25265 [Gemmata sp.]|nr:hypothetical protein [Gemmata sp.]